MFSPSVHLPQLSSWVNPYQGPWLLYQAYLIYRKVLEAEKPDTERNMDFQERNYPRLENKIKLQNIDVDLALQEKIPAIYCDVKQIQQSLIALIINAVEAITRSAVYYCGEIRLTPEWNPFARIGWVEKYLGVAWWQWVFFTEVGRVAPSWSFSELHSDMKFDVGAGVRAMVKGLVVRIDLAGSSESWNVSMMVSQPFQW